MIHDDGGYSSLPHDLIALAKELESMSDIADSRLGTVESIVRLVDSNSYLESEDLPKSYYVWNSTSNEVSIRNDKDIKKFKCVTVLPCNTSDEIFSETCADMIAGKWLTQGFDACAIFTGIHGRLQNFLYSRNSVLRGIIDECFENVKIHSAGVAVWGISDDQVFDAVREEYLTNLSTERGVVMCDSSEKVYKVIRETIEQCRMNAFNHSFVDIYLFDAVGNNISMLHVMDFPFGNATMKSQENANFKSEMILSNIISQMSARQRGTGDAPKFILGSRDSLLARHLSSVFGDNKKCFFVTSLDNAADAVPQNLAIMKLLTKASTINVACTRCESQVRIYEYSISFQDWYSKMEVNSQVPMPIREDGQIPMEKPLNHVTLGEENPRIYVKTPHGSLAATDEEESLDFLNSTTSVDDRESSGKPSYSVGRSKNGEDTPGSPISIDIPESPNPIHHEPIEKDPIETYLREEIAKLRSKQDSMGSKKSLQQQIREMEQEFESQIHNLETENEELEDILCSKHPDTGPIMQRYQDDKKILIALYDETKEERQRVDTWIASGKMKTDNIQTRIKHLSNQNERMRRELMRIRKLRKVSEMSSMWLSNVDGNYQKICESTRNARVQLEALRKSSTGLETRAAHAEKTKMQLSEAIRELENERGDTSQEITEIRKYLSKVDSQYEKYLMYQNLDVIDTFDVDGLDQTTTKLLGQLEAELSLKNPRLLPKASQIRTDLTDLGRQRLKILHREYQVSQALKSLLPGGKVTPHVP